tara:strand:+ start:1532 stop:1810 length:279 start_codon:yes stop_codon:yes gene_type:complete
MVIHVIVHLAAVATGLFLQEFRELLGKSGVLEVTDTVRVHVTDVKTGTVLVVDTTIQKLFQLLLDVHIKFVLVEFTDVVLESVKVVADVLHM